MKLKPLHAILIFVFMTCCSIWASYSSYRHTKQRIVDDMNQALALTLAEKSSCWITPDTIQDYRSHLKLNELKDCSFVYYAMNDRQEGLCSRKMKWQKNHQAIRFQGYANCSAASIFSMSDQSMSSILSILTMLWVIASFFYFRHHHKDMMVLGGLMMNTTDEYFYDLHHQPIKLTPMQMQLMRMFFTSANHKISKHEICTTLWPKKPDASETLYTLIRRLKPIVEKNGNLEIVSERGKDYQLRIRR